MPPIKKSFKIVKILSSFDHLICKSSLTLWKTASSGDNSIKTKSLRIKALISASSIAFDRPKIHIFLFIFRFRYISNLENKSLPSQFLIQSAQQTIRSSGSCLKCFFYPFVIVGELSASNFDEEPKAHPPCALSYFAVNDGPERRRFRLFLALGATFLFKGLRYVSCLLL